VNFLKDFIKAFGIGLLGITLIISVSMLIKVSFLFVEKLNSIEEPYNATYTLAAKPKFDLHTESNKPSLEPLISIYRKINGKFTFYCTAFVVTDKYAITAGHCLLSHKGDLTKDIIQVRDPKLKETGVYAKAASINTRADLGVITGDFRTFKKFAIDADGLLSKPGPFYACGFGYGNAPPQCYPFKPTGIYGFAIKGNGFMYPGMSGGPVIDRATGAIVGVNIEVGDSFVVAAPLVGFLGALELELAE
jgi:hypothetical protein